MHHPDFGEDEKTEIPPPRIVRDEEVQAIACMLSGREKVNTSPFFFAKKCPGRVWWWS
jgi:hypothetical protein